MIEKAAQYCHTTLKRQLEYCGYYPVEWALNAATLSQYYLTKVIYLMFFCCNYIINVTTREDNCLNSCLNRAPCRIKNVLLQNHELSSDMKHLLVFSEEDIVALL